jgi:chromosome segregation ATPase
MDINKLRNDYLKKINKTASELNRRLSFLNEINNTISHNNMIGGSLPEVKEVIGNNDANVAKIKTSIMAMKQQQTDTNATIVAMIKQETITKDIIDKLEDELAQLKANVASGNGSIEGLRAENGKLEESIKLLINSLNTNTAEIQTELNKTELNKP